VALTSLSFVIISNGLPELKDMKSVSKRTLGAGIISPVVGSNLSAQSP